MDSPQPVRKAFVVRTDVETQAERDALWASLQQGLARMGWSYADDLDLGMIVRRTAAGEWDRLTVEQKNAWYCHGLIDRAQVGDLLFYPKVDQHGRFAVARVTGEYMFLPAGQGIKDDFRSARRCELLTATPIAYDDAIVPAIIRHKLGLQGRFYELREPDAIAALLAALPSAGKRTREDHFEELIGRLQALEEDLASRLPGLFPAKNMSAFLSQLLGRMGHEVEYLEGPSERGSDIVLVMENPFVAAPLRVGIQVGSYTGNVSADQVSEKLKQLLSGWSANRLDYGALVLTGACGSDARAVLATHNKDHPAQAVRLLDGGDMARLVLSAYGQFRSTGRGADGALDAEAAAPVDSEAVS